MKNVIFGENGYVVRNENMERYRKEMNERKTTINDTDLRSLIEKAQNGNEIARNKVVEANLCLVWSIAATYGNRRDFEDLLQCGNIGLINAVATYDVSRETLFSTWALTCVKKQINIYLTDLSRSVRTPSDLVYSSQIVSTSSIDAPISNEDGEEKTMLDFMASDTSADTFSKVEDARTEINALLNGLKEIEKEIVCGLFGFGCREYTQYELSKKFGLTEERIRQIKWTALEKMKNMK